jgi:hypothetical protein
MLRTVCLGGVAVSLLALIVACSSPSPAIYTPSNAAPESAAVSGGIPPDDAAAAAYCKKTGGIPLLRNAWYTTASGAQARLDASALFCHYVAKDKSTIDIAASTLYSTKPTLAAMAYLSEIKMSKRCSKYLDDPAVCYCRDQLDGSDFFLQGGSWIPTGQRPNGNNRSPFCVFSDFSVIDSWGLTYHSAGIVRGIDLSKVMRYKQS